MSTDLHRLMGALTTGNTVGAWEAIQDATGGTGMSRFRDNFRNIPDQPSVRDWGAAEVEDFRICEAAKLTLQLAASALMALPRCQTPGLPDVRDIVTDMRELIERLERAGELIDHAIESEDVL